MDSNQLSPLLIHHENETKPKCVPLEHWIPNKDGTHMLLNKGYVFNETMDYKDLRPKILLLLNNHMRKKGVEHASNNSRIHKDKHGRFSTKKYVACIQSIIHKNSN